MRVLSSRGFFNYYFDILTVEVRLNRFLLSQEHFPFCCILITGIVIVLLLIVINCFLRMDNARIAAID